MYCPRCGIENPNEDVKFCRGCGEDLRLTSQALGRRIGWTAFLNNRLDNMLEGRYGLSARDGGINIFIGLAGLMIAVYYMLTGVGSLLVWVVISLSLLLGVGVGVYDVIIYRRSVRGFPRDVDRLPGDLSIYKGGPKPLPQAARAAGAQTAGIDAQAPPARLAPPSVTESTTRHLERGGEGDAV
jgi:hypothetical protein